MHILKIGGGLKEAREPQFCSLSNYLNFEIPL